MVHLVIIVLLSWISFDIHLSVLEFVKISIVYYHLVDLLFDVTSFGVP